MARVTDGYFAFAKTRLADDFPFILIALRRPSLTTTRQALYSEQTSFIASPKLAKARFLIVLQTHYPNRLDVAYFRNMSSIVSAFLPLTYPFMDARTSAKLRIGGDPLEDGQATKEELHVDWGGVIDVSPS